MTSSEKKIEKKLRLGIEALGGLCWKFPAVFIAGVPDRLCILPGGLVFFVETKGDGKPMRALQFVIARKIERRGIKVYLANSEAMVTVLLDSLKEIYKSRISEVHTDEAKNFKPLD